MVGAPLTIEEAEGQEEGDSGEIVQALDVLELQRDEQGCGQHDRRYCKSDMGY